MEELFDRQKTSKEESVPQWHQTDLVRVWVLAAAAAGKTLFSIMAAVEAGRLPSLLAKLDVFYPKALALAASSRHYSVLYR